MKLKIIDHGFIMEDKLAEICYKKYKDLGKNGKPKPNEWTLLAGFIQELPDGTLSLVSLATGTKCIGKSKMSQLGSIVNDSHAEILARRGLLRYFYEKMESCVNCDCSELFSLSSNGKFVLKPGIVFHFFCSHVPCGDASIIPMRKRKSDHTDSDSLVKKQRISEDVNIESFESIYCDGELYEDVHRTGGKCVGLVDPLGPGKMYHTVGAVRTKPGRGEPTLSLSCSDKIAKWIYCGVQGALLSLLLTDPIQLESITIGGGGQFCAEAMKRALLDRSQTVCRPTIKQSSLTFQNSRYKVGLDSNPCATSIIWVDVKNKPLEVSVEGRKLGVTKKCLEAAKRLKISKMELFKSFINLSGTKYSQLSYGKIKAEAESYYRLFKEFKKNMGCWTCKPDLLGFLPDT